MTVLTEEEQLAAFLQHWIVVRVGLIKKYEERIVWWATQSDVPLMSDRRRLDHYRHELAMLEALQRRALRLPSDLL